MLLRFYGTLCALLLLLTSSRTLGDGVGCSSSHGDCRAAQTMSFMMQEQCRDDHEQQAVCVSTDCKPANQCLAPYITTPAVGAVLTAAHNVTVVASPSANHRGTFDTIVQWDHSMDDGVAGYEIRLWQDGDIRQCGCIGNRNIKRVLFRDQTYDSGPFLVEVISLPYQTPLVKTSVSFAFDYQQCDSKFHSPEHCTGGESYYPLRVYDNQVTTKLTASHAHFATPTSMLMEISWSTNITRPVLIALSDSVATETSCNDPAKNPPCFIASDTSDVTIHNLQPSKTYYLDLHTYSSDAGLCSSVSGLQLYNGCGGTCCKKRITVAPLLMPTVPILRTTITTAPLRVEVSEMKTLPIFAASTSRTTEQQHTSSNQKEHNPISDVFRPSSSSKKRSPNSLTTDLLLPPSSSLQQNSPSPSTLPLTRSKGPNSSHLIVVGVAVGVAMFACVTVLLVVLAGRLSRHHRRKVILEEETSSKASEFPSVANVLTISHSPSPQRSAAIVQRSPIEVLTVLSACDTLPRDSNGTAVPALCTIESSTEQEQAYVPSSRAERHPATVLPVGNGCVRSDGYITADAISSPRVAAAAAATDAFSVSDFSYTSYTSPNRDSSRQPSSSKNWRAIVVYSPRTPLEQIQVIQHHLLYKLSSIAGVSVTWYGADSRNMSEPEWLEVEEPRADAIIVVPTPELREDWEGRGSVLHSLVYSLRNIVHGKICRQMRLSEKFAVVLLKRSYESCVPVTLESCQCFEVLDTDNIAHFVMHSPRQVIR